MPARAGGLTVFPGWEGGLTAIPRADRDTGKHPRQGIAAEPSLGSRVRPDW